MQLIFKSKTVQAIHIYCDGAGSTQVEGVNNTSKFRVEDVANRTMFNVDSVNEETTAVSFIAQSIIFDRVIYTEEQPITVDAGTFTSGAWRTREFNTTRYSRQTTRGQVWFQIKLN